MPFQEFSVSYFQILTSSQMHLRAYTALCLYAGLLALLRIYLTGDTILGWLIWNLILALIPYFFALLAVKQKGWKFVVLAFLWLLFFPNALYIFTDFIHLGKLPEYIHFDIVLISTTALAGLISGFASLEIMHTYWNRHYHRVIGWIIVSSIMLVSLFGVYIGRFLRFNSWDLWYEPSGLLREVISVLLSPNTQPIIHRVDRATESLIFGAHLMNVYGFIALYFWLYMLLYIFLYHTKKVR